MAEIQFDNEQEFARPAAYTTQPRGMIALVMKWGLAKDEKSATRVLIGVAIGAVVLAFLAPMLLGTSHARVPQNEINAAMQSAP